MNPKGDSLRLSSRLWQLVAGGNLFYTFGGIFVPLLLVINTPAVIEGAKAASWGLALWNLALLTLSWIFVLTAITTLLHYLFVGRSDDRKHWASHALLEGEELLLRRRGETIRVPLSEVTVLNGGDAYSLLVELQFRHPTEFGSQITFAASFLYHYEHGESVSTMLARRCNHLTAPSSPPPEAA